MVSWQILQPTTGMVKKDFRMSLVLCIGSTGRWEERVVWRVPEEYWSNNHNSIGTLHPFAPCHEYHGFAWRGNRFEVWSLYSINSWFLFAAKLDARRAWEWVSNWKSADWYHSGAMRRAQQVVCIDSFRALSWFPSTSGVRVSSCCHVMCRFVRHLTSQGDAYEFTHGTQ